MISDRNNMSRVNVCKEDKMRALSRPLERKMVPTLSTLEPAMQAHSSLHMVHRSSRSQHKEQMQNGNAHGSYSHKPFAQCFYNFVITRNKEMSVMHSSVPTTVPTLYRPEPAAQTHAHNPRLPSLMHIWHTLLGKRLRRNDS